MAEINVIDLKTNKITKKEVNSGVFSVTPNLDLVSQYVYIYRANHRQGTQSTKSRALVSGGGRKPWVQKGTGRARQGSIRSPQWVHGGVAHGPNPRDWSLKFPKKMRQLVTKVALTMKASKSSIYLLENLSLEKPSTKELLDILHKNKLYGKSLFVLANVDENIIKSASNIRDLEVAQASNLNAYEILKAENLIFVGKALETFLERFK